MKDEVIRVRVEPKLKEEIRKKSGDKMSSYLRGLAINDLANKPANDEKNCDDRKR